MAGMLKKAAPLSYEAWIDYDVSGARLSRGELEALSRLVSVENGALVARPGATIDAAGLESVGLARREIGELLEKLTPKPAPDFELDPNRGLGPEVFAERFASAVPKVDRAPDENKSE